MEDRLFSLAEAAAVCGRAKSTLTRARTAGKFPNAQQDSTGRWMIPLGDLMAAHFLDHVTPAQNHDGAPPSTPSAQTPDAPSTQHLQADQEIKELRHQLELAQVRLHQAHLLVEAKDTTIRSLEMAVHALESAPVQNENTPPTNEEREPTPKEGNIMETGGRDDSVTDTIYNHSPDSSTTRTRGSILARWARSLFQKK